MLQSQKARIVKKAIEILRHLYHLSTVVFRNQVFYLHILWLITASVSKFSSDQHILLHVHHVRKKGTDSVSGISVKNIINSCDFGVECRRGSAKPN